MFCEKLREAVGFWWLNWSGKSSPSVASGPKRVPGLGFSV